MPAQVALHTLRERGDPVVVAQTDAIDARLLALFGKKAEPPIRPILQGRARLLADLVARRRQLVSMTVAEKNRRDTASPAVRRSIEALLRTLAQPSTSSMGASSRRFSRMPRAPSSPRSS